MHHAIALGFLLAAGLLSVPSLAAPKYITESLGKCSTMTGVPANIGSCQAVGWLSDSTIVKVYPFNVTKGSQYSIRVLAEVQNGHIQMCLFTPDATDDTCLQPTILMHSAATERLVIKVPITSVEAAPGMWKLEVKVAYGAPEYSIELGVTPGNVLLNPQDAIAVHEIFQTCCKGQSEGGSCYMLRDALYNPAPSAASDLCHQDAMACDNQGHIEDFMLAQFTSVSGLNCTSFPPAFGALPKLRRLDLSNNGLNTDISNVEAVLGNSKTVRWLMLWATGLTGTLSCNIVSPSLTLLSLTKNDIEGTIPPCFTQSPVLRHFYMSSNKLSGALPSFSPESVLEMLSLAGQRKGGLSGELPDLSAATKLRYVQLGLNSFTGLIPILPAGIKLLNVSFNQLSGPLPSLPLKLTLLDIASNQISGVLPDSMSGWTQLLELDIDDNTIDGNMPTELPPNIHVLSTRYNKLGGTLPPLPATLRILDVGGNFIAGSIPDMPTGSELFWVDLSSNNFEGGLPQSLMNLGSLTYLNASFNQLNKFGDAKEWKLPALLTLDLSSNEIEGPLDARLALAYTAYMNVSNNQLKGSFDAFAAAMPADSYLGAVLDVSTNQLSGPLPEALGELAVFSTAIPTYPIARMLQSSDKAFNVSYNALDGPFPRFLYKDLPVANEPFCNPAKHYEGGCNIQIKLTGNNLLCPKPNSEHGMTDADYAALKTFDMGCIDTDGSIYEVASVLKGEPKLLEDAHAQAQAQAAAAAAVLDPANGAVQNVLGDGKGEELVRRTSRSPDAVAAAAAAEADAARSSNSSSSTSEAIISWAKQKLPIPALVGIIVVAVVGGLLLMLLVVVVVYRRRFSSRPDRNYRAGPNGAGAVTGPLESTIGPLAQWDSS